MKVSHVLALGFLLASLSASASTTYFVAHCDQVSLKKIIEPETYYPGQFQHHHIFKLTECRLSNHNLKPEAAEKLEKLGLGFGLSKSTVPTVIHNPLHMRLLEVMTAAVNSPVEIEVEWKMLRTIDGGGYERPLLKRMVTSTQILNQQDLPHTQFVGINEP